MRDAPIFNIIMRSAGGGAGKHTALKVPRQFPPPLLVKAGRKQGSATGSDETACWEGAAEEINRAVGLFEERLN